MTVKSFSRRSALLAAGGAISSFAYGSLIERNFLNVERVDLPWPERFRDHPPIKLALLSDFHYDDFGNRQLVEAAVEAINQEQVDLVMLGGDFFSHDGSYLEPLGEILQNAKSRLGTYSVFGNHDRWHGDEVKVPKQLDSYGIRHLTNESVNLDGCSVMGVDSVWGGRPRLDKPLNQLSRDQPAFSIWHEPDTFDFYDDSRVVLQMSGHTHGGQVCAPFKGELLLPKYGQEYAAGLYQKDQRSLYVNRGLGVIGVPTRFLCPPELTIIQMAPVV